MEGYFGITPERFLTPDGGILLPYGSGVRNDVLQSPKKNLRPSASSADEPRRRQAAKKNFLIFLTSYFFIGHRFFFYGNPLFLVLFF